MAKQKVYAGPLSTKMYCAIGMVAVAWAGLEEMIGLCLSRMLGADHVEFLTVSTHMQVRGRLEAVRSLIPQKFAAEDANALSSLCDQATTLARERNKILHASWLQGETPDIAIRFTYRAFGKITADAPTISAQEIAMLADQITNLAGAFTGFLLRTGLFDPADPLDRGRVRPQPNGSQPAAPRPTK